MGSVFVGAALVGLRVVLAVLLERVAVLLAVARVAGGGAELLHLVPRRRALAARRVLRARLLRLVDALRHLVRDVRRRRRPARPHRREPAAANTGKHHASSSGDRPNEGRRRRRRGRQADVGQRGRHGWLRLLMRISACDVGVCSCCDEAFVARIEEMGFIYIYIAPWGGGEGERGFDDVHSFLIASSANRRVPRGLYFEIFHAKWGLGKGDLFLFPWVNLR